MLEYYCGYLAVSILKRNDDVKLCSSISVSGDLMTGREPQPRVQECRMPGCAVDPRRCRPYARPPAAPLNSTRAGPAACVSFPTVFILSNTIHSLYNVYYAMFVHVLVVLKLHGVNKGNHIKTSEMWPPLYKGQRVVPQWWPL